MASRAEGGYGYYPPGVPFQLPNQPQNLYQAYLPQQTLPNNAQQTYDRTISYSLSPQDYNYPKQYKNGPESNHQVSQTSPTNNKHYPNQYYNNYHNLYNNQNGFNYNGGSQLPSLQIQQNPNSVNVQTVKPVITKHIYFHVPPPDVEAVAVDSIATRKKKTYNIVFIKVPSQQLKQAARLQGLSNGQFSTVVDKTLIYVLVKKPDDQLSLKNSSPNHEVFYVKYKGNPEQVVSQITQQNTVQTLHPGLVNGQN